MQTAALAAMGLAPEWTYGALDVAPGELEATLKDLPARGFAGVNVTIPHKVAALGAADRATPAAVAIGAANTLTFAAEGIVAENTDAPGFLAAVGFDPRGHRALVLGAGGAARAVVWALVESGADVTIWNRTRDRAVALAGELGGAVAGGPGPHGADCRLIVNATSVGMGRTGPGLKALPLDADALNERQTLVDLAYGTAETELVTAARRRGASIVDGIEVLVHQGAASLRSWTGREVPVEVMRRAAREPDANRKAPATPEARSDLRGGDGSEARRFR
jgi:shikimate dehydrogenase